MTRLTPLSTFSTAPTAEAPVERGTVTVAGCEIAWWATGTGGPPVVLVHGGGAHSGWWHPVVPLLSATRRVVGFDLSGHGDSGRREVYTSELWADELAAVIREGARDRAFVVAHSMGGRPGSIASSRYPERVLGLVLVDTVIPTQADEIFPRAGRQRRYATLEEAVPRFRIAPGEAEATPEVLHTLALQSLRQDGDAYLWKFDPEVFNALLNDDVNGHLPGILCPLVAIQGSRSQVARPEIAAALAAAVGRTVPLLTVPGAYHHVMLDRPDQTAALLDWLLASGALTRAA